MNRIYSPEIEYSNQTSLSHRKKFAQFFTPARITKFMANWILCTNNLQTILEPAFGLGIFSRHLLSQNPNVTIKGYEIDDLIIEFGKQLFIDNRQVTLVHQDYMLNDWSEKFDGIICNPPYFKFQDYDNQTIIPLVADHLKCTITKFTNLYALFLLKSLYQLKPDGRCAYIIPSEFLNSDYGKWVKSHLLQTKMLRHIIVIDFKENVFNDALTTSAIILCANDQNADTVCFSTIHSLEELDALENQMVAYPRERKQPALKQSELNPEGTIVLTWNRKSGINNS